MRMKETENKRGTSKIILIQVERWTISPLIRQSFLLSSSTVFRFSIQAGST